MSWKNILKASYVDPNSGVRFEGVSEESVEFALMYHITNQKDDTMPVEQAKQQAQNVLQQFTPKEVLQDDDMNQEVITHKVIIQGDRNKITGYVLEKLIIQGDKTEINIVAPINIKINDMGNENKINIEKIPMEQFAERITRDKGW